MFADFLFNWYASSLSGQRLDAAMWLDAGEFMRLIGAASILVLICATLVQAAELPSRKPGLWQVRTSIEGGNVPAPVIKQCIDATTDQMMQSSAGPLCSGRVPRAGRPEIGGFDHDRFHLPA
jgi:hypothetical protein